MASSISSVPYPMALKNNDRDDQNDDESESPKFLDNKNSNRYDLNSEIMVTAIISLSAVVILVLALHVYARYALRRHARRRREAALHRLTLSATQAQAAPSPKPAGLDPFAIASLPAVSTSSGSDDCAVCLGAMAEGEAARLLPRCSHAFHVECIDAWLASQASCPVCRAAVVPPPPPPEPRESPSAPPLGSRSINATPSTCMEAGTTSSEHACCGGGKALSNSSRFSSFRRMITRERSSSGRVQSSSGQDQELIGDLERQ